MVGCVFSQLKPSELYILILKKASALFKAKNVEFLGFILYVILSPPVLLNHTIYIYINQEKYIQWRIQQ